jgi:hypothetical protein
MHFYTRCLSVLQRTIYQQQINCSTGKKYCSSTAAALGATSRAAQCVQAAAAQWVATAAQWRAQNREEQQMILRSLCPK